MPGKKEKRASRLWYLLPVFFGILGGIAGYFLLRRADVGMAHRVVILGMVVVMVSIPLGVLLLLELPGVFVDVADTDFEIVDAACAQGVHILTVRNNVDADVPTSLIDLQVDGVSVGGVAWSSQTAGPGQVVIGSVAGVPAGAVHNFRIVDGSTDSGVQVGC